MFIYRTTIAVNAYAKYLTSISIFFVLLLTAQVCTSFEMLIGTGGTDSFSYFAGKTFCSSIKKYDTDVACRLVPIEESADKLTNLQNDSIDLALVNSKTIYDALHGSGLFQYITIAYDDLRLVMPLYKSPISLIARRDAHISKLDDLPGKRVNSGVFNTFPDQVFKKIMSLKGWQKGDFPLYQNLPHAFSQDFLALKSGSVQAMLHVGMHPDKSLKQLFSQSQSTLVGL
ncbi:MAG: TAXI family TRAP transporter solute-binding subunit, partial [Desulforhopalus sp.]